MAAADEKPAAGTAPPPALLPRLPAHRAARAPPGRPTGCGSAQLAALALSTRAGAGRPPPGAPAPLWAARTPRAWWRTQSPGAWDRNPPKRRSARSRAHTPCTGYLVGPPRPQGMDGCLKAQRCSMLCHEVAVDCELAVFDYATALALSTFRQRFSPFSPFRNAALGIALPAACRFSQASAILLLLHAQHLSHHCTHLCMHGIFFAYMQSIVQKAICSACERGMPQLCTGRGRS